MFGLLFRSPQRRATSSGSISLNSPFVPSQPIQLMLPLSASSSSRNCHSWIWPLPANSQNRLVECCCFSVQGPWLKIKFRISTKVQKLEEIEVRLAVRKIKGFLDQRVFRPIVDILITWTGWSRLIWHNFVKVAGAWIKKLQSSVDRKGIIGT